MINIHISTCDSNMFIIKYFQYFFNKYWSKNINVKILGFSEPDFKLEPNFEFISLGKQQIGGAKGWSNYLIDYFSNIEDEYFIFGLDDFMIARPVNQDSLNSCFNLIKYAKNNNIPIGRIDLQCSLQYARDRDMIEPFIEFEKYKFIKLINHSCGRLLYKNAAAFSIWNKEWFLKNIRRDWTPWQWESIGSNLADGDGYNVIGVVNHWPIKKVELLSSHWSDTINVRGLRLADVEEIKKLSNKTDRIVNFKPILDEKWYYEQHAGKDWEKIILGD